MFLKKYFPKYRPNDCFVCTITTYNITTIFMTISGRCEHSKSGPQKPHFFSNHKNLWAPCAIQLIFIIMVLSNFYPMSQECGVDNMKCLKIINDFIFGLTGVVLQLLIEIKLDVRVEELNAWLKIAEERENFGFDKIWPFKNTKPLMFRNIVANTMFGILAVLVSCFLLYENDFDFSFIRYITVIYSGHVQLTVLWQYIQKTSILYGINDKLIENIKMHLDGKINGGGDVESFLCKTRRFVAARKYIFDTLNNFIYQGNTAWMLCCIICLILSIYLLLNQSPYEVNGEIIFMETRTYMTLVSVCYMLYLLDSRRLNEEIIPYLFKYPISKLNPAEATQLELLINTLISHRPVLKTSDIFTIGTNLIASISGTVVTYVLVALQFQASWKK